MPAYKKIDATTPNGKRTIDGILELRKGLNKSVAEGGIPPKTIDPTLILATWNIREFGKKSKTNDPKDKGRDQESLFYIAEIISRFDIVALQEVQGNLDSLDELIGILGGWWRYLVSDSSLGTVGGSERHAYIYDTRKVVFGQMAGEVVPEPQKVEVPRLKDGKPVLDKNNNPIVDVYLNAFSFARTPYIAGFKAGWFKFTICTQHFNYGKGEEDPQRVAEATQIAKILSSRVDKKSGDSWANNAILLGDFNVFEVEMPDENNDEDKEKKNKKKVKEKKKIKDETLVAIENMKFQIPTKIRGLKTNTKGDRPFDQITFLSRDKIWQMDQLQGGTFRFFDYVYRDNQFELYGIKKEAFPNWRTFKMSDHMPLWVELKVDFGDEYLLAKQEDAAKDLAEHLQEPIS